MSMARCFDLSQLLDGVIAVPETQDVEITGFSTDSRSTRPGDVYVACPTLRGQRRGGVDFIADAIKAGAVAVIYPQGATLPDALPPQVPLFAVEHLEHWLGPLASRYYGHPSRQLRVIGVTGTNGKTSTSHFIAQALREQGPCGVIGTLGNGLFGSLEQGPHTTPDAVTLQALLAGLREAGARHVVMEVSSHGIDQGRVSGVTFNTAVFTNLSRDHLDYHGDMASYSAAKRRLFHSPGLRHAIVNADDEFGRAILADLPQETRALAYTLGDPGTLPERVELVRATRLELYANGMIVAVDTPWGKTEVYSHLLGRFNASNLLAAMTALLVANVNIAELPFKMRRLRTVSGRMEPHGGGAQPQIVIDYAHSPDALGQVLNTLRALTPGKLVVVFGCGGNRDQGKRPQMGLLAAQLADAVIITDDNPRNEDPAAIVADILAGITDRAHVSVIHDRALAIRHAITQARPDDLILIAGKGHEDYQIVGDKTLHFSDREVVRALLAVPEVGASAT